MRVRIPSRAFLLAVLWGAAALAPGASPVSVKGTLTVGGKPLELHHAWLIRGPDGFDAKKIRTYVVMSRDDISEAILRCGDTDCAIFGQVKAGLVLGIEPEGFWVRAVHPELKGEKQFSGPVQASYGWKPNPTPMAADRAAGRLTCIFEPILCDLEIDAKLLKEFSKGRAADPK